MKKVRLILYPLIALVIGLAVWALLLFSQSRNNSEAVYTALTDLTASETTPQGKIEALQQQNPDTVAWICIDGTKVDYPVLQTPKDPEFYLTHDFMGREERHGAIFLEAACDLETSDHLTIYGHDMQDGTMFAPLLQFKDADFCKKHPTIQLETAAGKRIYTIAMVMLLSEQEVEDFPFYRVTSLRQKENYEGFLKRCGQFALWKNKTQPRYGEKLLTLATCDAAKQNGRLAVLAWCTEER